MEWFQNLCHIALQARKLGAGFVTTPGTTADPWVRQAAHLFRIPLRQLKTTDRHLRDQQLCDQASRVYALWVRPNGNVIQALQHKIDHAPETVWVAMTTPTRKAVAINPTPDSSTAANALLARGAVAWLPPSSESRSNSRQHIRTQFAPAHGTPPTTNVQPPIKQPQHFTASRLPHGQCPALPRATPRALPRGLEHGEWLIHATRARSGPLPGQSTACWATEVLLGGQHGRPWDPADVLREILRRGVLRATQLRQGDPPVVCFSRQSLARFLARRTFRAHRGRWDAEPFGIAINAAVLKRFGARAVHYGSDWNSTNLPSSERWLFQPQGRQQQWREEQEWRAPVSIPLNQVPPDEAIVFVPDSKSALHVLPFSRWAVMLTPHIAYT